MPAMFVLIWSTGFIVAKFGLPYAPPLTFLVLRYALSIVCFLVWIRFTQSAFAPFDERIRLINEVVKPGYAHLRAEESRVVSGA